MLPNTDLWTIVHPNTKAARLQDRFNFDNGSYHLDLFRTKEEAEEFLREALNLPSDQDLPTDKGVVRRIALVLMEGAAFENSTFKQGD